MKENRKNFRKYLHGAIFLISVVLGTFGMLGYIHYADKVEQLISDNLPYGTLSMVVQVTLCLGILFTYPLQIYPVVEIAENFFFRETKERSTLTASFNSEHSSLVTSPNGQNPILQRNRTAVDESSEDESSEDESNENPSAEELNSISKDGYRLLVKKPWRLFSCDMVSYFKIEPTVFILDSSISSKLFFLEVQ